MIIIGEKINTSIKIVQEAVEQKDKMSIQEIAQKQVEAGANYLDVNCGTFINDEVEKIDWLIQTVQEVVSIPICIDSPNSKAIQAGLKVIKNGKPIVNSITGEKVRWDSIVPLVTSYKASVIVLCMDDNGIPENSDERLKVAVRMANELIKKGVYAEDIYFDPMVEPISTNSLNGLITLESMQKIKKEIPGVHLTCGLSNISFGLPTRKIINQAFLVAAIIAGLDTAIINPLDKKLMSLVYAAEALAGKDEYCMEYIAKYRSGFLEG